MKTSLKLLSLLCVLFHVNSAIAQTYYYNTPKTFYENGYTYQCDDEYGVVLLYNKANQLTYVNQTYKDGNYIDPDTWIPDVLEETWTRPKASSIVNNAFSVAEKSRIKQEDQLDIGNRLGVTMYISSETGKVIEVEFRFRPGSGYGTVPVLVYRNIETELKSKIWFTPNAEGKKKNYIIRFWNQKIT